MTQPGWRTPIVVLTCGTLILLVTFGARQIFGLFITPISADLSWDRDILSSAMALQALVWGATMPLAGVVADRFGAGRVVAAGGILYALGLFLLAHVETPFGAMFSLGVLCGLAMSTAGFSVILAVISRSVSEDRRSLYLGIASAGGSSGQFVLVPATQYMIDGQGWVVTLIVLAVLVALVVPLSAALAVQNETEQTHEGRQSIREALYEAARHRGFLLLNSVYFVCGFQVSFISVHLPGYLTDAGASASLAAWGLAFVGLFNIVGCFVWGRLGDLYAQKYLLSIIYLTRAIAMTIFLLLPISTASVLIFASVMGLLWLATVPLTSGMVAQIFGLQYMATLVGVVFLSHQLGGALGVWLGGEIHAATGSYDMIWWIAVAIGLVAALLNLPIDDRPVARLAVKGAQ